METTAAAQQGDETLVSLLADIINRGAQPQEIVTFVQVMERQQAREDKQAFFGAMVEFKKKIQTVVKEASATVQNDISGEDEEWSWATLGQICESIIKELAAVGISHHWEPEQPGAGEESGMICMACVLTHMRGHSISSRIKMPPDQTVGKAIHAIASAITYAERYSLLAAVGIGTKAQPDNNGQGAADDSPIPSGVPPEDTRPTIDDQALARGLGAIKKGTYKWESMVGFYRLTDAQLAHAKKELNLP
jgi:hypothetical protein